MFGFLIKKAFFDMWDNMLRVLLMNLGYILVLAIFFLLAPLFLDVPPLFIATVVVGIAVCAVYTGVVSRMCSEICDYRQPGFSDIPRFLKESFGSSLLLAAALAGYVFVVSIAFRFYGGLKSLVGPLAVAVLFWVTVGWLLASQFFFPLQSRLDRKFRKIFRKTFLLFFDNPAFSIGLFLCSGIVLLVSFFTALLLPGLSSILLLWNAALKLRLYKYDWLEKNPGPGRRSVPWDALLVEDRERVGKRTLKGMIFPWKE
jgi:small-conductance mechanosensitive channel